jgi:hypothetical protein
MKMVFFILRKLCGGQETAGDELLFAHLLGWSAHNAKKICMAAFSRIHVNGRWVVSFTEYEDEEQETAASDLRQA